MIISYLPWYSKFGYRSLFWWVLLNDFLWLPVNRNEEITITLCSTWCPFPSNFCSLRCQCIWHLYSILYFSSHLLIHSNLIKIASDLPVTPSFCILIMSSFHFLGGLQSSNNKLHYPASNTTRCAFLTKFKLVEYELKCVLLPGYFLKEEAACYWLPYSPVCLDWEWASLTVEMKYVLILVNSEEIRYKDLGPWMSSWRIVTMSALDYSHQDYLMKTVKNKTFIQFESVNLLQRQPYHK